MVNYLIFNKINKILYLDIVYKSKDIEKGLMFRNHLDENRGMLFVFNNYRLRSFWMKNTYIPLDILFINDDIIVDIKENNKILSLKPIKSTKKCNLVLEVNANYVKKNNIKIGDYINII